jgi:hypothetical protein
MEHLGFQFINELFMTNSSEDHKFTWGDMVIIKKNAPSYLHPGEIASVCSVVKIDPEDVKKQPSLIEPTWLYTVEFGDGSSIELPQCYLELYKEKT